MEHTAQDEHLADVHVHRQTTQHRPQRCQTLLGGQRSNLKFIQTYVLLTKLYCIKYATSEGLMGINERTLSLALKQECQRAVVTMWKEMMLTSVSVLCKSGMQMEGDNEQWYQRSTYNTRRGSLEQSNEPSAGR